MVLSEKIIFHIHEVAFVKTKLAFNVFDEKLHKIVDLATWVRILIQTNTCIYNVVNACVKNVLLESICKLAAQSLNIQFTFLNIMNTIKVCI